MKKIFLAVSLLFTAELSYATCLKLASMGRSVENSVALLASSTTRVEFSWDSGYNSVYDEALRIASEKSDVTWHNNNECVDVTIEEAPDFMSSGSSWYIRLNSSMTSTFKNLFAKSDFKICHSRFNLNSGKAASVTYDFVSVESTSCDDVKFSFGTKETWGE